MRSRLVDCELHKISAFVSNDGPPVRNLDSFLIPISPLQIFRILINVCYRFLFANKGL